MQHFNQDSSKSNKLKRRHIQTFTSVVFNPTSLFNGKTGTGNVDIFRGGHENERRSIRQQFPLKAFKSKTCLRTKACLLFCCQRATVAAHMTTICRLHLTKPCPSRPGALAQRRRQTVIPLTYYSQQKQ